MSIISDGEKIKHIGDKQISKGNEVFSKEIRLFHRIESRRREEGHNSSAIHFNERRFVIRFAFRTDEEIGVDAHLESILACESTMIVLETIETIIQVCSPRFLFIEFPFD